MVNISIIVPMYNEEKRAGRFLKELSSYCRKKLRNYEIIFVDDGSTDKTLELAEKIKKKFKKVKIISYKHNQGKGYAVKKGIEAAKGKKVIFIDADGSIKPNMLPEMIKKLDEYEVVIGNRYINRKEIIQPWLRELTGNMFNIYVELLFNLRVNDCLCGFKGFRKKIGKALFKNLIAKRWIFDVEIIFKTRKRGYNLYKLPIKWVHMEDTKMSIIDPFKMLFQLIVLRLRLIRNS